MRDIVLQGIYNGFYSFGYIIHRLVVQGEEDTLAILTPDYVTVNLPFELMNVQEFEEIRQSSRMIKSAQFVVDDDF